MLPNGWTEKDNRISRTYETDGWPTTLMAVNQVGFLCEAAFHHADLEVSYGSLTVHLPSHDAGGVTDRDRALAAKIEEAVLWRPEPDSPLDGPNGDWVKR